MSILSNIHIYNIKHSPRMCLSVDEYLAHITKLLISPEVL